MHHKIGQRIDVLAALAHIAPVGLEHAQLAARRIDVLRPGDGLLQGFFAIGRAVRMVHLVPFLPEQRRLAEQPVHLLFVAARPEGQRAAEREIGLRLAGEFLLPAAFPQGRKVLGVLRRPRLFQHLLVAEHDAPGRLFCFALPHLLPCDVVLVNPRQGLRAVGDDLGCALQPVACHGKVAR